MKSRRGVAAGGKIVNPSELPEEPVDINAKPKAAPSPGLPISEEEYKRLKEAAKQRPPARIKNAQEDQPRKNTTPARKTGK